ncbi:methionine ABC transporter ATP-binding protein, partial [Streptomyces sp. SID11233]|nr:methionine ABC transporter ATP-binding protein [Streptomyces sp. SID11233]
RCTMAQDICRTDRPPLVDVLGPDGEPLAGRRSACHFWKETVNG